jgi:hypothetical protein
MGSSDLIEVKRTDIPRVAADLRVRLLFDGGSRDVEAPDAMNLMPMTT